MNALIGTVKGMDGKFFAKDADGNVIELSNGDSITQGMIVFGDKSNSSASHINIEQLNGDADIAIVGKNEQMFDSSLIEEETFEEGLSLQSVSDALVLDDLEESETSADDLETAAGEEAASGSGGTEDEFADRDAGSTDITTELRDTSFESSELPESAETLVVEE